MMAWEARGFQARRIQSADKVIQVVTGYERFVNSSIDELKKKCADAGLVLLRRGVVARDELLEALKGSLIWEVLPFHELQKECQERALPKDIQESTRSDDEKRLELIWSLKVEKHVAIKQHAQTHIVAIFFDLFAFRAIPLRWLAA